MAKQTTTWSFDLGDKLRDKVTGYTGVLVARTEWLNGCIRLTLQPPVGADSKIPDSATFDDAQLEMVEEKSVTIKKDPDGGPTPSPTMHPDPTR